MPPSAAPKHTQSLANELISGDLPRPKHRKRKSLHDEDNDENSSNRGYVDSKASRKILKLGQSLAEEEDQLQRDTTQSAAHKQAAAFGFRANAADDENEEEGEEHNYNDEEAWGDEQDVEEEEVDVEDLEAFNRFLPAGEKLTFDMDSLARAQTGDEDGEGEEGTDLADLILQRIAEHESTANTAGQEGPKDVQGGGAPEDAVEIPTKVVDVYEKIGQILSRYKSGKLPKIFKQTPSLPHWEELVMITRPESWTPNATAEATKIFVSAKPAVAKPFLENVLLPAVRDNINEYKKLNVHLYKALQKATYRPAGFFKGVVFPLIESGTCTLKEAEIVSSIISRSSIPPLHAGAAMLRLTDIAAEQASSMGTENSGATNIFLRKFLEKGYALPYKVVDNLVFHFLRFRIVDIRPSEGGDAMTGVSGYRQGIEGKLPVLWHQSLLVFAQRYRNDITEDQREALLDLLQERGHRDIGPEVRRELLAGRGRGVVEPESRVDNAGDDTMMDMDVVAVA